MSAARRNGRRTIFCWCKSRLCKSARRTGKAGANPQRAEKRRAVRTGEHSIFRALRADAPRKRPHPAQKRSVFLYAVSCCDKCAGKYTVFSVTFAVVPRKGDVDRNQQRAAGRPHVLVVPRKGDVDRNNGFDVQFNADLKSSPARGTWIEIDRHRTRKPYCRVVPRKGDVDRNIAKSVLPLPGRRRPPQGGRG